MKRFLVVSADASCAHTAPRIVIAYSESVVLKYLQKNVVAKESCFRDSVLDLACNMSFAERFYLATDFERKRLERDHQVGTEPEIVRSRIKKYFEARPDIGEKYLRYMDTEDASLITEDVFEFIAENEASEDLGFLILDLDAIETITVA